MSFRLSWTELSERVSAAFVRPRQRSSTAGGVIITTLVLMIGALDYYSGIEISLSLFYLVPISLATAWFGLFAGTMASVACTWVRVVSDMLTAYPSPLPWHTWWNAAAALAIMLFVAWLLDALIALHRDLEGQVTERTDELRAAVAERQRLEREILEVTGRERNAFGRELHDDLGQHFVATALAAQVLAQSLDGTQNADKARAIVKWIEEGIAKTRKLARGLLLEQIDPSRLAQELEELAVGVNHGGVQCRVQRKGPDITASPSDCAQLFRIAQEAVGNALRHGHPATLDIMLVSDEHALCLIIEDDGAGIPAAREKSEGMGLRIMEHRARVIGASFSIASVPGEGTKVICRLPVVATAMGL